MVEDDTDFYHERISIKWGYMMNAKKLKALVEVVAATTLFGCASTSDQISSSYVSPLMYQSLTCEQIKPELLRVNNQLVTISGVQDETATKDAVAMTVGMVVFWPALFLLAAGDDKKAEIANLKGQYQALESSAIQKNCDVAPELINAKKQREELEKKKKEEQKSSGVSAFS